METQLKGPVGRWKLGEQSREADSVERELQWEQDKQVKFWAPVMAANFPATWCPSSLRKLPETGSLEHHGLS